MLFQANPQQTSYGEDIGILLLDTQVPFIRGDVGNARSYRYPVRYKRVDGLTAEAIFRHDRSHQQAMIDAAQELEREGVKAITGDCGFMALFQEQVQQAVQIPVFLSSLCQLSFMLTILPTSRSIGIVTANSVALVPEIISAAGCPDQSRLVIQGLENTCDFRAAAIEETGVLNSDRILEEVLEATQQLLRNPALGAILLECSLLPPYGHAVQRLARLPVFDYLTMIDFVHATLEKQVFPDQL